MVCKGPEILAAREAAHLQNVGLDFAGEPGIGLLLPQTIDVCGCLAEPRSHQ